LLQKVKNGFFMKLLRVEFASSAADAWKKRQTMAVTMAASGTG
jgi:hypothetical protein